MLAMRCGELYMIEVQTNAFVMAIRNQGNQLGICDKHISTQNKLSQNSIYGMKYVCVKLCVRRIKRYIKHAK